MVCPALDDVRAQVLDIGNGVADGARFGVVDDHLRTVDRPGDPEFSGG